MKDYINDIEKLITLRDKLKMALDKGDKEEANAYYNSFMNLYKKITGKEFKAGLEPEKLVLIEAVIEEDIKPNKTTKGIEKDLEI